MHDQFIVISEQERDFPGEPASGERRRRRAAPAGYSRARLQIAGLLLAARW